MCMFRVGKPLLDLCWQWIGATQLQTVTMVTKDKGTHLLLFSVFLILKDKCSFSLHLAPFCAHWQVQPKRLYDSLHILLLFLASSCNNGGKNGDAEFFSPCYVQLHWSKNNLYGTTTSYVHFIPCNTLRTESASSITTRHFLLRVFFFNVVMKLSFQRLELTFAL